MARMAGQRLQILIPFATARAGGFTGAVLWPEGAMPDLATLQSSRRISHNGTLLETRWRADGAPYTRYDDAGNAIGTSLRLTYADFVGNFPGVGTAGVVPSAIVEVVAAPNNPTPATFDAWARALRVRIAYTEVNSVLGNTVVNVDVAARAQLAIDGSSWVVRESGGQLRIEFECYIGPGRHARALRLRGHNESGDTSNPPNPPVWIDGLTHWKGTITQTAGNAFAHVHGGIFRDAPFPYPSAPPDGGARFIFDPARPTHLNPGAPANSYMLASWAGVMPRPEREELERPRALTLTGFSVTVDHATTPLHWRPWHVRDHATGAGPAATLPTSGNTTTCPELTGIGDGEGFVFAGTVSSVSSAHAAEVAANPFVYLATPTLAHMRSQTHRRTFTRGILAGARGIIRGPWLPLQNVPQARLDAWLAQRVTLDFRARTFASPWHGWAPREGHANPEVNPPGANQGGVHYVVGWNGYGQATLAGSGEHLYAHCMWAWRWFSARGGLLHPDILDVVDLTTPTTGRVDYTAMWEGTAPLFTSRVQWGRRQYGGGNSAPSAWWNGAVDEGTNPDPRGRWERAKKTHHTTPPLYWVALLTDCPMARYLLRCHGNMATIGFSTQGYPFDSSARSNGTRSEGRGADIGWHAWMLSTDTPRRARIFAHWISRLVNYMVPGHGATWRQFGGDNSTRDTDAAACGAGPNIGATNLVDNQYLFWQAAQVAWSFVRWAWDAPTPAAERILEAIEGVTRATLDHAFVCDPARLAPEGRRASDDCWAAALAYQILLLGANNPGIPVEGVLQGKSKRTEPTNLAPLPITFATGPQVWRDVGRRNDGVNEQTVPILFLARFFPSLRLNAGAMNRWELIFGAYQAIEPQHWNGDEYVSQLGFAVDHLHDDGGPVIDPPVGAIDVTPTSGTVGAIVTIDAGRSTFGGPSAGVSIKFWAHYDPTAPGAANYASAWDTSTRYLHTYNAIGTFFPAIEITQEDGRRSLRRSSVPVRIDVPAANDPPEGALELTNPTGPAPHSVTLDASGSTFIGAASGTTLRFWRHFNPAAPSAPDATQLWTAGQTYVANYTQGGVFSPAMQIVQPDGQSDFVVLADAVLVVVLPIVATFSVSARSGTAPFTPTFNAEDSTRYGPDTATTLRWWRHYDPQAPTAPDLVQLWSVGHTYSPTYASPGIFHPALELVQQDGRSDFYRDAEGIRVDVVAPSDSPVLTFTVAPRAGTVGMVALIEAAGSTVFGPTSAATLRFWRNFVPSAPGAPDRVQVLEDGTNYAALYDAAGTFHPAVELTQQDGQRAFLRDRIGVVVGNVPNDPPRATLSVPGRSFVAPASVLLNAGGSTFTGTTQGVTLQIWKHYNLASPGAPDATLNWTETTAYLATYNTAGVFNPAVLLTDSTGRQSFFRDELGIQVDLVLVGDPPTVAFTSAGPRVNLRPGSTLRMLWTSTGPLATAWLWYWRAGAGPLNLFGTSRDPILEIPRGYATISVMCEASNEFGIHSEENVDWITILDEAAPTAGFELAAYSFGPELEDWPSPYAIVAANWGTPGASHEFVVEPGGRYPGERPLEMLLLGPGDFTVTQLVSNTFGTAQATRRVTVLAGNETRGTFSPRGELLSGSNDPNAEGLTGTLGPSSAP